MKSIRFYLVVLPLVLTCCNTPGAKKGDKGREPRAGGYGRYCAAGAGVGR